MKWRDLPNTARRVAAAADETRDLAPLVAAAAVAVTVVAAAALVLATLAITTRGAA